MRAIMDALSPKSPYQEVVLMKATQIGATEAGNNWVGFNIHHHPGPMLYVQPTVELAKRYSKQRVAPMIESCPALQSRVKAARSRDSGNTILVKEYPGGFLAMTGANSAPSLASMPVRDLFLDEVDRYPIDLSEEGDPIEIARRRTDTFGRSRKIFIASSPTTAGISRIEAAYERTDQNHYHVPCPFCGNMDWLRWERIKWAENDPWTAKLHCQNCDALIPETKKTWMLSRGEWRPECEGERGIIGFHISALYSPLGWRSWAEIAVAFLDAKRKGPENLKTWVNTYLGETWEERGTSVSADPLMNRREEYGTEVPEPILVLTAGVDIQEDRIELEVVGWGDGEESWSLDFRRLMGNPHTSGDIWERLNDILLHETWQHASGVELRIQCSCVDSGFATKKVYEFVQSREARQVFAIKGVKGGGEAIAKPSQMRVGKKRRKIQLWRLGVDEIKSTLYSRLTLDEPGPGFCHFPLAPEWDEEWFKQLTAEKRVLRVVRGTPKYEWIKTRPRNEVLDCRVYATGALAILNPAWRRVKSRMETRFEAARKRGAEEEPDPEPKEKPTRSRRGPARRRRPSWVQGWK
jgi:phage terminase large subunit GpA-like protein